VSYSDTTQLEYSGLKLGEVAVTSLQFGVDGATAVGPRHRLLYGVDYGHIRLDRSAGVPLPGNLQEVSLPLGLAGPLAPDWNGQLMLRPGFYGDSLTFSGRQVNVPVLALASYCQSAALSWTIGLRYDAWARNHLLPFVGVNWKFAPQWELAVGMPRAGVSWQFAADAALRVGASLQGGSYYVTDDPRPIGAAAPALGATKLDYREIRVGAALELFSSGPLAVLVDVGAIVDQRFDYHRRNYRFTGDTAAYATLSARARF
jgi:hypothetical protein